MANAAAIIETVLLLAFSVAFTLVTGALLAACVIMVVA